MAQRYDVTSRIKARKTDAGLLRVPARLTRTGVFSYTLADGSTRRELRHPDEVFAPDSLASLRGVPVVEGHPAMIDQQNWNAHARGDVRDDVARDDRYVAATLAVNDAATIGKIDAGKLVEISCGYTATLEEKSGTYDGEDYDAVQHDIRYNHVGLGPSGWGRAGAEVRMHLDGDAGMALPAPDVAYPTRMDEKLIEALEGKAKAKARADVAETATKEAQAATAKEAARADAAEARADLAESALKKSITTLDARVAARISLEAAAHTVAPKFDCAGKSDAEVKAACVHAANPDLRLDGKAEAYIDAAFDLVVSNVEKAGLAAVRQNVTSAVTDAGEDPFAALAKKGAVAQYGKSSTGVSK